MSDVPRPVPPPGPAERLRQWFDYLGPARIVSTVVAVLVVSGGAWFLTTDAAAPPEAALPRASVDPPTSAAAAPPEGGMTTAAEPVTSGGSTDGSPGVGDAEPEAPVTVLVHVAGAVADPGVHRLDGDARVGDAVRAAGGGVAGADLDGLNLAAPVVDGSRLVVPRTGEEALVEMPPSAPADAANSGSDSDLDGPVDVNHAPTEALDRLPGVGPATAAAIVTERETNGPFVSVDDLERVAGIGPAKLAAIRDLVTA